MSDLIELAYLQEQLGPEKWNVLLDRKNTERVRGFCDQLLRSTLKVIVGGLHCEILSHESVKAEMFECHELPEMTQEKFERLIFHFLNHDWDIPAELRGKCLIFLGPYFQPHGFRMVATAFFRGPDGKESWNFDKIRGDKFNPKNDSFRFVRFLTTFNPCEAVKNDGKDTAI